MFNVSVNTILWANDMKKGDKLVVGDTLIILPIDGVQVTVAKGDTLQSLAKKYNITDPTDIALYNGIPENTKLAIGDELIIPNGIVNDEGGSTPIKSNSGNGKHYNIGNLPSIIGYFMNPVPGATETQGLHDGYAVDLAISRGTPIHAAASGTVIFARAAYNGGYGYMVMINHPNGTRSLYAHMSKVIASVGDQVSQGEVIGLVGSTGHSTGPHVHFELHGVQNPGSHIPVGAIVDANWHY
jgi:murein DD-endopeptidase MepM/ murein hydrolase activator NlpD